MLARHLPQLAVTQPALEARVPGRQLDRRLVCVAPDGEVRELLGLSGRCRRQFGATVAGLHHEEPGEPVEVSLAGGIDDPAALAALDHVHRLGRQTAHAREVHPEMPFAEGAEALGVVGLVGSAHRVPHW